jgi:tetratricopeptide (TPR) repeat protein
MKTARDFKHKVSQVQALWAKRDYDKALSIVEELLKTCPGSAALNIMWASLVQLQEDPDHDLDEVKKALESAVQLDKDSPAGPIELGHFYDAVEDNPHAASRAFAEGIAKARHLLIDGLLGQARALLQLNKRKEANRCLIEALYLTNMSESPGAAKSTNGGPDLLLRGQAGAMLAFQMKGPFAEEMESLLQDVLATRSA